MAPLRGGLRRARRPRLTSAAARPGTALPGARRRLRPRPDPHASRTTRPPTKIRAGRGVLRPGRAGRARRAARTTDLLHRRDLAFVRSRRPRGQSHRHCQNDSCAHRCPPCPVPPPSAATHTVGSRWCNRRAAARVTVTLRNHRRLIILPPGRRSASRAGPVQRSGHRPSLGGDSPCRRARYTARPCRGSWSRAVSRPATCTPPTSSGTSAAGRTRRRTSSGWAASAWRPKARALLAHVRDLAVVGLWEVVSHLPRFRRIFRDLLAEVDRARPDLAVLVDYPDFNLRVARALHRRADPRRLLRLAAGVGLASAAPARDPRARRAHDRHLSLRSEGLRGGGRAGDVRRPPAGGPRGARSATATASSPETASIPRARWSPCCPGSRRKEIAHNLPAAGGRRPPARAAEAGPAVRRRGRPVHRPR